MPQEEHKENKAENVVSDGSKSKNSQGDKEKTPGPGKATNQTENEPSKSNEDKFGPKAMHHSTNKAVDDKNKSNESATGQKTGTAPAKSDQQTDGKTKESEKDASKRLNKTASTAKAPSDQKSRKPSITISGTDSGTGDLVKSAMQKARRASIRSKGRSSSVSHSLLAPKTSRRISAADVALTLEAENVWDLAVKMKQISAELADPDEGQRETTLIVLGGKQSGKTTLIGQMLDSEDAARRTLGLDYTYARRAGKGISRDVCQVWELGGGTAFLQLLDTPVSADRLSDTACVIMVDLTHPETILPTVESTTKYLTQLIDKKLKEAGTTGVLVRNLLTSQVNSRRPEGHPDTHTVKPLLIPLALVGGMYDKLQKMDTAEKKVVAEAMRWAAHKHFASLLYFSSKEGALQARAKDLLTHLAFGEEANPRQSLDVQKPLQIAAGADSFRAIGGGGDGSLPYDVVLGHVSARWPPQPETTGVPEDPSRDALFAEPDVDAMRAEKAKELDRLRQDLERRRKMAQEREAAERMRRKAPAVVSKQAAQRAAAEFLERHHGIGEETRKVEVRPGGRPDVKKTEVVAKAGTKDDGKDVAKTEVKAPAKPVSETEAKPAAKSEAKADAKPAAKSDDAKDAKAGNKADNRPAAQIDAKPAPKPDAKSDAKPDAKPETKSDIKQAMKK